MKIPQKNLCLCVLLLAMVTLAVLVPSVTSRPGSGEVENVAEALRYLEQIDKYYSQMARPRFGRSIGFNKFEKKAPNSEDTDGAFAGGQVIVR